MIHVLQTKEVLVITPDGPKGPPYKIKKGILFAAAASSSKIFPLTWKASRFWQLPTWDHAQIPKPFSRIAISIGVPVSVSKEKKDKWNEEIKLLEQQL